MKPLAAKFLVLTVSSALAALLVALFLRGRATPPSVVLSQTTFDWGGVVSSAAAGAGKHALEASEADRFPPSRLIRRPLTESEGRALYSILEKGMDVFDPLCGYRKVARRSAERPWEEHPRGKIQNTTNSLGLRDADEPMEGQPNLRVLVIGDSHTEGLCDDDETFPEQMEARLRSAYPDRSIEFFNAARGGYSLFEYLGVLERWQWLQPDVVIVNIYGGNDFDELLTLHHFFQGTARPPSTSFAQLRVPVSKAHPGLLAQGFNTPLYFKHWPDQVEVALEAARDLCTEMQILCARRSTELVIAYLPPMFDVEPQRHSEMVAVAVEGLELTQDEAKITDRMADSLLAFLRQRGIHTVDFRPAFRAATEQLYWSTDHHMNVAAEGLAAQTLLDQLPFDLWVKRERVRLAAGIRRGEGDNSDSSQIAADLKRMFGDVPAVAQKPRVRPQTLLEPRAGIVSEALGRWPATEFDPRRWVRWRGLLSNPIRAPWGSLLEVRTDVRSRRVHAATNEGEPLAIVVVGDENIVGTTPTAACFADALRASLQQLAPKRAVQCIDAACPGQFTESYVANVRAMADALPVSNVVVLDLDTDLDESARARRLVADGDAGGDDAATPAKKRRPKAGGAGGRPFAQTTSAIEVLHELEFELRERGQSLFVVALPPRNVETDELRERTESRREMLLLGLRKRGVRVADLATLDAEVRADPLSGLVSGALLDRAARALAYRIAEDLPPESR